MAKANIIAKWIEMSRTYLSDAPPRSRHYEANLFVNHCEVRQVKSGLILVRKRDVVTLEADSPKKLTELVADFCDPRRCQTSRKRP